MNYTNPQKQLIERHQKKSKSFSGFLILFLVTAILLGTTGGLAYNAFVEPLPDWGLNFTSAGVTILFFLFLLSMLISGGCLVISFIMVAISSDDDISSDDEGVKSFQYFIAKLRNRSIGRYFYILLHGTLLTMMVANGYIWTTGFMVFFWLSAYVMAYIDRGLRDHYVSDLSEENIERLEKALVKVKEDEAMEKGLSELEKRTRKEAKDKMRRQGCKQEAIDEYEDKMSKQDADYEKIRRRVQEDRR